MYFHLVPNAPKFFNFYYLPTLFTVLKIYNVILCQLFFQQTGVVKTLPQHNPLILSFFLPIPMNSQFDLFKLTEFLFFPVAIRCLTNNIFTLQFTLLTPCYCYFNQLLISSSHSSSVALSLDLSIT